MNIDLALAKREYVLEKNITDNGTIAKIRLIFRDINKANQAVFDVYTPLDPVPEGWALTKYNTALFDQWTFPANLSVDPITVSNYINRRTGVGMTPEDIAFVNPVVNGTYQVMMSVDSMYFASSFILRIAQ